MTVHVRRIGRTFTLFLASLAVCPPLAAQHLVLPDSGTRIRVLTVSSPSWEVGTFVGLAGDTLLIIQKVPNDCCYVDTLSMRSVNELDVSRGRGPSTAHVLAGMAGGLLVGVAAGVGAGAIGCHFDPADGLCGLGFVYYPIVLGTVGMITGTVLGVRKQTEQWERIYPPRRASIFVVPTRERGLAVGLALAFGGSR